MDKKRRTRNVRDVNWIETEAHWSSTKITMKLHADKEVIVLHMEPWELEYLDKAVHDAAEKWWCCARSIRDAILGPEE